MNLFEYPNYENLLQMPERQNVPDFEQFTFQPNVPVPPMGVQQPIPIDRAPMPSFNANLPNQQIGMPEAWQPQQQEPQSIQFNNTLGGMKMHLPTGTEEQPYPTRQPAQKMKMSPIEAILLALASYGQASQGATPNAAQNYMAAKQSYVDLDNQNADRWYQDAVDNYNIDRQNKDREREISRQDYQDSLRNNELAYSRERQARQDYQDEQETSARINNINSEIFARENPAEKPITNKDILTSYISFCRQRKERPTPQGLVDYGKIIRSQDAGNTQAADLTDGLVPANPISEYQQKYLGIQGQKLNTDKQKFEYDKYHDQVTDSMRNANDLRNYNQRERLHGKTGSGGDKDMTLAQAVTLLDRTGDMLNPSTASFKEPIPYGSPERVALEKTRGEAINTILGKSGKPVTVTAPKSKESAPFKPDQDLINSVSKLSEDKSINGAKAVAGLKSIGIKDPAKLRYYMNNYFWGKNGRPKGR